mgnify:CR=1 FL=1
MAAETVKLKGQAVVMGSTGGKLTEQGGCEADVGLGWEQVTAVLKRERCTVLYFDMVDVNGLRVGRGASLIIWVVAAEGTVLAHEVVDVASVLDTQVNMYCIYDVYRSSYVCLRYKLLFTA